MWHWRWPAKLKAMAIAVRTYALENADRHRNEGFGLCDSTHCQVLKFGQQSAQVERAVQETAGETLWYDGRRATVFYTQNCGGQSEAARSAWPGVGAQYLSSHPDPWCMRHGAAVWHAEIPVEQVRGVFRSEGWKAPAHIDAVRVTKRTDAGRAVQLEFAGDGATVPVTASSFRFAMDRMLGWNQLRSDWFTVTLSSGALHFEGHGYGHGVGLCQAGATEMAAEGHSAPEILSFYFPGTRVGVTAEDRGWSAARGTGWTLWATGGGAETAELVREGNSAWVKAEALFAPQGRVQPEVWEMPSTELFRQTTAEPGWMLASSAGTRVFLQPEAVLNQNRGEGLTLVHEFLHVLVESEAAAQAPLWLREGVVEALAQDSDSSDGAGRTVSMAALEAALTRPASQAESQWAHVAAKKMARAMIAQFGLAQVRQWLRTGSVPEAVVMRVQASR
jgi:stage II sporulation protein D